MAWPGPWGWPVTARLGRDPTSEFTHGTIYTGLPGCVRSFSMPERRFLAPVPILAMRSPRVGCARDSRDRLWRARSREALGLEKLMNPVWAEAKDVSSTDFLA